ncbi:hypothetical protein ACQPXM_41270 (plasmid) [Kribbella sp. CA-253562]|uniref:hypothetical protein n=1 Tax=Kribbella sp. CA-253562 TaxID=3239942 RepID=UPI003D914926
MGQGAMVAILLMAYAAFVLVLSTMAGCVAIFGDDAQRRDSAYRVLKFVLSTGTGAGGVAAVAAHLYQSGIFELGG